MAAVSELRLPELVELRQLRTEDLHFLLEREIDDWRVQLDWDFRPSAELVRRFVGMRALTGYAMLAGGRVGGYVYSVADERKGLVGDLYILPEHRTVENENRLLDAVLDNVMRTPYLHRIECQLLMLDSRLGRPLPRSQFLSRYPRCFMAVDTRKILEMPPGPAATRVILEEWTDRRQDAAARVIAAAYQGHIDSSINDQYRSVSGSRRFLTNIVQYPGCGAFYPPASFVSLDADSGGVHGLSVASLLAPDVGHITQICVSPEIRGTGVGYELLRRSLTAFARAGCRKASLTVTAANHDAVRLYERAGFRAIRAFSALVWEGW
jgi:ribosomal protein S18 acetylase RimI-like enzyme